MEREDEMAAEASSRYADVPDNADEPSAWNKHPVDMPPDSLQFIEELLVIVDMTELVLVIVVLLEIPIGR